MSNAANTAIESAKTLGANVTLVRTRAGRYVTPCGRFSVSRDTHRGRKVWCVADLESADRMIINGTCSTLKYAAVEIARRVNSENGWTFARIQAEIARRISA
jgi:hypothetical protein